MVPFTRFSLCLKHWKIDSVPEGVGVLTQGTKSRVRDMNFEAETAACQTEVALQRLSVTMRKFRVPRYLASHVLLGDVFRFSLCFSLLARSQPAWDATLHLECIAFLQS